MPKNSVKRDYLLKTYDYLLKMVACVDFLIKLLFNRNQGNIMKFLREYKCQSCGKIHKTPLEECVVERGAVKKLPEFLNRKGVKKVFIFADVNTFKAGGEKVEAVLKKSGIEFIKYVFKEEHLEPDEFSVGSAIMHFDKSAEAIIGIGSGVINDICKIVANVTSLPYVIVATAPSMDGYASGTSSMAMDGLKISLPSKSADVVIGDIDILKTAPFKMTVSGLGDMLAKYVSILEWRISNLINGEYYCEDVASLIRGAVKKCVSNIDGILTGDDEAIKAVFEGLVLGGIAMNYAGCSRPASGVEHYFSHVWDMRGLEFNTPVDFHGIQCAVGTLYAVKLYEQVLKITPSYAKGVEYVEKFNYREYKVFLKEFLGKSANSMIELETKEGKYDVEKHKKRLKTIIDNWDKIVKIINEEIISSKELTEILDKLNAPKRVEDLGIEFETLKKTFVATKDIRDKYVLSRLCFDLGIIDELKLN